MDEKKGETMKIRILGEDNQKWIKSERYAQSEAKLHKHLYELQRVLEEFDRMGLTVSAECDVFTMNNIAKGGQNDAESN